MGKQKKLKIQHLSDAEIWDDSALIRSWDEAVAEYEYYHSIHARGEDVEEVLRQAELAEKVNSKPSANTNGDHVTESASASIDADFEDGQIEDEDLEESVEPAEEDDAAAHDSKDGAAAPSATNANTRTNGHSSASTKGSIQVLENMKMAYWWAGYYSGLYEGQQQAVDATITQEQHEREWAATQETKYERISFVNTIASYPRPDPGGLTLREAIERSSIFEYHDILPWHS